MLFDFEGSKNSGKRKAREQSKELESWVVEALPSAIPPNEVRVNVSEVQCGSPGCSPIDTVITFWFPVVQRTLRIPASVDEVTKEVLADYVPTHDCLLDWYNGIVHEWPEPDPPPTDELRFQIGQRVSCCVGVNRATGERRWTDGNIIKHWYRQSNFPLNMYAPYQILLDNGSKIFCRYDADNLVRLSDSVPSSVEEPQ